MSAQNCLVTPGFFRTMRMRLARGRDFDTHDTRESPPVVVINEALADQHWKGQDPVGARIILGDTRATIIAVVSDVRHNGPTGSAPPAIYRCLAQYPTLGMFLVVRSQADRADLVAGIRRRLHELDPNAVVVRVRSMDDMLVQWLGGARLAARLMSGFALLALVLAAIGLYGTVAQWVDQRRHEMGVRMALGASPRQVLILILRQGLALALASSGVGLFGAALVTRAMSALLYGVSATDPTVFALVPLLLVCVALVACYAPARRAAAVDPIRALRAE